MDLAESASLAWAWLLAGPAPLVFRLLVTLAALPVLYRALGEPGSGWSAPPREMLRRGFWALLGTAIFFTLTARWVPEEHAPTTGRGFEAFVQGTTAFRMEYAGAGEEAETVLEQAEGRGHPSTRPGKPAARSNEPAERLREASDLIPESVYLRRYAGIALADRGRYEEALTLLDGTCDRLARRDPDRARSERALWHRLYGPVSPSAAELPAESTLLHSYRLGWIGDVALLAGYRHAAVGPPAELTTRVETGAARWYGELTAGSAILLLGLAELALISLVVGAVLVRTGVLRTVIVAANPVGPVLWEAFILMMAVQLAPGILAFGPRGLSPERQPAAIAFYLISLDLLQALSFVYLWWRLRQRGCTLAEVGLTGRQLGANITVGLMAAVLITPAAFLVGWATQQVSQRYFPNIAPPFHPLGLYTATSTSPEIRFAWFFAAAIGAPLIEETFFRGALFGALRRRFGLWPGVLLSSGVFAILHPQLPLGFIPIFVIGASFALLAHWRKSLVPGMVAHAFNNSVAFAMLVLLFPGQG